MMMMVRIWIFGFWLSILGWVDGRLGILGVVLGSMNEKGFGDGRDDGSGEVIGVKF